MKRLFIIFCMMACISAGAQTKPVPKPASGADINQMIEAEMKRMGLTEKEKEQMRQGMKMSQTVQEKGSPIGSGDETLIGLPKKQTGLISKIPVLNSREQYLAYIQLLLSDCRKTIPANTASQVNQLLAKYKGNINAQINIGPLFLVQKDPVSAVYASLSVTAANPDQPLARNNLAVILHQTGYAQNAIPILQYTAREKEDAQVLNNLGQSYLTLGDTAKAASFFRRTLRIDPDHPDANCGIGLILSESGKVSEATPHIIRSLKNGYSPTADALRQKHKIKIKFSDVRQDVPEYFNPQKYKPIAAAKVPSEVLPVLDQWSQLDATTQFWVRKKNALHRADDKMMQEKFNDAKKEPQKAMEVIQRGRGHVYKTPLSRKAAMMMELVWEEWGDLVGPNGMKHLEYYLALEKNLSAERSIALEKVKGKGGTTFEECELEMPIIQTYLTASSENYENCVRSSVYKLYDFTNQSLYWEFFLQNETQYQLTWHDRVAGFFGNLYRYKEIQPLNLEFYIRKCQDVEKPENDSLKMDTLEINCPVSTKVSLYVAKYKMNCHGWEIEAGEGVIFNIEKDYKSGDFTIAIGPGIEDNAQVIELGAKGQMFIRFDKDLSPVDIGAKFEAGGETNIKGFMVEEKINCVIGVTSGVNVNVNNVNQNIEIFSWSPVQTK
jgi:tetratricopeptide (TPR) repeat protein